MPDAGLSFEPAELVFETETDTGREGVIRVRHRAGKPARGYVYPSERCMRGVREQFAPAADGTGYIRWQFDARGSRLMMIRPAGPDFGRHFRRQISRERGCLGRGRVQIT